MAYEQAALVRNPRCLIEAHPAEAPSGLRFTASRAYEMAEPVRLHFRHFELVQPVASSSSRATCETRFWCAPGPVNDKTQDVNLRMVDKFAVNMPYESSDAPPQTLNIAGGARSESPPPVLPPRAVQADRANGVRTEARTPPGVHVDQADSIRTEARPPPRSVHGDRAGGVGTETRPPAKAHPPLEARPTPEGHPPPEPLPPPDACPFREAQPPTETSPPPSPPQDTHGDKAVGRPAIVPRPLQGEDTDDLNPGPCGASGNSNQEEPTRVRRGKRPGPATEIKGGGIDDDIIMFGGTGSEPGQFQGPNGVVASADGEIFVADMHNRRIAVHNMNGTFLRHFPTSLPGSSKRMNPHDVTMDTRVGSDHLWVVGRSWVADHVVQYSRTGSVLGGFTLNKTQSYRGIAFDARRGNILLSASREEQSCVLVTNPNGTVVHTLTHPDMNEPYGVTVDQAGRSFVSDVSADTVFVFNRYGNFLYNFGSYGVEDGQIMRPSGICTAGLGHIVVASSATVRLELFTSAGEYVRSLPAGGQMHSPDGVAVGPRGRLIVTDSTDDTVYIFPTYD
ncbi:TRIM3 [Branchiostoma lanceolatum]|uniref:TRIM3 protein n=1 Tax=Branchiostoma lanceolatum TaxID=7740 RepID=A0A8J9Z1D0_BRALA|nr:TRIM3 [Branchiostoma lanceolatum]